MTGLAGKESAASLDNLVSALLNGEQRALARAITNIENGTEAGAHILAALRQVSGRGTVVGITGPPGVGKSTLIDGLIRELRSRDKTVCILAVDPSSPVSGGAILGDRIRMAAHAEDKGVFIRSLAARGHLGGLVEPAFGVLRAMQASGCDFILVETVGTGQSEVEIAELADLCIVVCAPGQGDEVQAIKAGILEIADILVVNKSDQPEAQETVGRLQAMLRLRAPRNEDVAIIPTVAIRGEGVPPLLKAIEGLTTDGRGRWEPDVNCQSRYIRRVLYEKAAQGLRRHIRSAALDGLCGKIASGEIGFSDAAQELLGPILARDTKGGTGSAK